MAQFSSVFPSALNLTVIALLLVSSFAGTEGASSIFKFSPAAKKLYNKVKSSEKQEFVKEKDADLVFTLYGRDAGILNSTSPVPEFDVTINVVDPVPGYEATLFGALGVSDTRLFAQPDVKSPVIGAFRFSYAWLTTKGFNAQATGCFEFTGAHGSSPFAFGTDIVFSGHDDDATVGEEYPIVGGTGFFRLARGFVTVDDTPVPDKEGLNSFYILKFVVFLPKSF